MRQVSIRDLCLLSTHSSWVAQEAGLRWALHEKRGGLSYQGLAQHKKGAWK